MGAAPCFVVCIIRGFEGGKELKMEKMNKQFKNTLILVVTGVILYVALINLKLVLGCAWGVISLFMPLIVGGAIAFILNVPMGFFEKQIDRLNRKRKTPSERLENMKTPIALVITLVIVVAVIVLIGYVIFPNLAKSIRGLVAGIAANYPVWVAKIEGYGIDLTLITGFIENLNIEKIIEKYGLSNTKKNGYAYYNCNSSDGLGKYNKEKFLKLREDFNRLKEKNKDYYEMFFTLIIFSFNNQIRFNNNGEFNLPVGKRDFNAKMHEKVETFLDRLKEVIINNKELISAVNKEDWKHNKKQIKIKELLDSIKDLVN